MNSILSQSKKSFGHFLLQMAVSPLEGSEYEHAPETASTDWNVNCFMILLDSNHDILQCCNEAILGFSGRDIENLPFAKLLAPESITAWERLSSQNPGISESSSALTFSTKEQTLLPCVVNIWELSPGKNRIVQAFFQIEEPLAEPTESMESQGMKTLYDYILDNLEGPLPTLTQLARKFGTNEHTLNDNFRKYFDNTVYRFYTDERLKRALSLIQQTNIPLKNISASCGFSTYTSFSRAFKKKYGKAPVSFKRWE